MFIKEINKRKNKGVGNIFLVKNDKNLLLGSRILSYDDDWEDTESSYDDMDVVAM